MAREDGTSGTLESFESFVDQLPEEFRTSRVPLKKKWTLLFEEGGLDMSHPCTGVDTGPCWLNEHVPVLNAVLGKAALHISVTESSELSIAPSFACCFREEEDELFGRLVTDWIVAHHSCLRELRFTSPGPVILRMPGVRRVDVSRVPGKIVVNAIQKGPLLESVKIHVMGDPTNCVDDLAAALRGNDRLKSFELSDNQFDPGSHKKLLEAISGCQKLESLDLEYDALSPEDVQALRSLLQKSRNLKKLSLAGIDSESIMAAINDLEGSCRLEKLEIFGMDNPEGTFSLSFTGVLEDLRVLSLACCDVKSVCAEGIAKHLVDNTSLKEVYLSSNDIGEAGALALAEALRQNSSLEQLDISSNELKSGTLLAFADALTVNSTLKTLRLCEIDLSDEQSDQLFEEDRFKDIFKRVYIVWSQGRMDELCRILIGDQHQTMLSLEFDSKVAPEAIDSLFSALSQNKTVTKLHFYSEADLTPAFAKRLADFLKTNDSVRWVQNLMRARSEELVLDILGALKHNRTVSYYQGYTDLITPVIASAVRELLIVNDTLNELILCDHYAVEPDILGVILGGLRENRTLVNLHIAWEPEVVEGLPEMWELLRRNKALVTLGARYVTGAATGADAAEALKMLHRSYALVKKVAEITGKSKELARKDIAMALAGLAS